MQAAPFLAIWLLGVALVLGLVEVIRMRRLAKPSHDPPAPGSV